MTSNNKARATLALAAIAMVTAIAMGGYAIAAPPAANDRRLDPQVRTFLTEFNKDPSPFWTLPGPQVRATLTGLQAKTQVDVSGVTINERTIRQDGRSVKIFVVSPENVRGTPPVFLYLHGGVWIAGNFENHKRLVRDLVVGSGAAAVFVEYTPIPDAVYPVQIEEVYAAAKWVAANGAEIGVDGTRMAVAGNSVGGDMSAVLALMAKDRDGPALRSQVLLIPATDAAMNTASYREFATRRFLARDFMKFGWDIYAPTRALRAQPYVSPLRATVAQLRGLPPALVITAANDPLRDEGEAYARKLRLAGVEVTSKRYDGTIHDFVLLNALHDVPSTAAALQQASGELRRRLSR